MQLYNGASPVGALTRLGGSWSIDLTPLKARSITARASDSSNNQSECYTAVSVVKYTTINTPDAPDLDAASDTGASSTDDLTNDTTEPIGGPVQADATVTVRVDSVIVGTGIATGGTYSIASSAIGAGAHSVTASATDLAGNASAESGGLSIMLESRRRRS